MALVMPLGALANKLVKIEGDLRFLSMKAREHAGETDERPTRTADARIELIHESLDAIKALLVTLQTDLHPKRPLVASPLHERVKTSSHKPSPDRDD